MRSIRFLKSSRITIQSHHRPRRRIDPHFRCIQLHVIPHSNIKKTCVRESGFFKLHRCSRMHFRSCNFVLGKYLSDLVRTQHPVLQRRAPEQRFALVQHQRTLDRKHCRYDHRGFFRLQKRARQRAQNRPQIRYTKSRNVEARLGHISISSMRKCVVRTLRIPMFRSRFTGKS